MSKSPPVTGKFRIIHMDGIDQDYVDAEIPAFILFKRGWEGEFHFGHISGSMDYEFTKRDGRPAYEWSFVGYDEMDPISGRGWAILQADATLKGKLFIHQGEHSGFTAEWDHERQSRPKGKRRVRAIDSTTGKAITVNIDKVKPGRIRQESLPDDLLQRIRAIHTAVKGVYDQTLEQMELNFMRDSDPEGEIALWEKLVAGMEKAAAAMPKLDRKIILRTLLAYSMGALSKKELADATVKKIITIAEKA